jgi:hypothetical protein
MIFKCDYCGIEFRKKPCEKGKYHNFCSNNCFVNFRLENYNCTNPKTGEHRDCKNCRKQTYSKHSEKCFGEWLCKKCHKEVTGKEPDFVELFERTLANSV